MGRPTISTLLALLVLGAPAFAQTASQLPQPGPAPTAPTRVGCGFLGVYIGAVYGGGESTITPGAAVMGIVPGTGAERAGIKAGDVITAIDGVPVGSYEEVRRIVVAHAPGSTAQVTVQRDGAPMTVPAQITAAAGGCGCGQRIEIRRERIERNSSSFLSDSELGLGVQSISPQLARYFHVEPGTGALVNNVDENSPAAKAGLQAGDVILELNGQKVARPEEALKGLKADPDARLTVVRNGSSMEITAPAAPPELR